MERRVSGRLETNNEASMFTDNGYFTAILENISVGGLFLRTNKQIELGEIIEVTIPLQDSPGMKHITVKVIAIRIMPNGVAFKFKDIDDKVQNSLLHLSASATA